jgi:hypothetical protein
MDITAAFGVLPNTLRDELLSCFNEILKNYREGRWEPSELNGGKLCEVVYTILKGFVDSGSYPMAASKPNNMVDACRALEQAPSAIPRSVRIQIPRVIVALYEVRNNRGVGHVGGDVNPNQMDATLVVAMSKWLMAELVRLFHDLTPSGAEAIVEALTERILPIVWVAGDILRVLDPKMPVRDQVLVLLYHTGQPVEVSDLLKWTEYSNPSKFRNDLLRKAHRDRLIEFNELQQSVRLSPKGIKLVETDLIS